MSTRDDTPKGVSTVQGPSGLVLVLVCCNPPSHVVVSSTTCHSAWAGGVAKGEIATVSPIRPSSPRRPPGTAVSLVEGPVSLLAEQTAVAGRLASATDAELPGLSLQAAARRVVALVEAHPFLFLFNYLSIGIVVFGGTRI